MDGRKPDQIIAGILNDAGDLVSGLALEPIGEDGHALANRLWKVAGYLRGRASQPHPYCTEHDQPLDWCRAGYEGENSNLPCEDPDGD